MLYFIQQVLPETCLIASVCVEGQPLLALHTPLNDQFYKSCRLEVAATNFFKNWLAEKLKKDPKFSNFVSPRGPWTVVDRGFLGRRMYNETRRTSKFLSSIKCKPPLVIIHYREAFVRQSHFVHNLSIFFVCAKSLCKTSSRTSVPIENKKHGHDDSGSDDE